MFRAYAAIVSLSRFWLLPATCIYMLELPRHPSIPAAPLCIRSQRHSPSITSLTHPNLSHCSRDGLRRKPLWSLPLRALRSRHAHRSASPFNRTDDIIFDSGAFSNVYKALDLRTNQKIASKSSMPLLSALVPMPLPSQSKSSANTSSMHRRLVAAACPHISFHSSMYLFLAARSRRPVKST